MKVLAWNIKEGFSDQKRALDIAQYVTFDNPDIAVLTEAYVEDDESLLSNLMKLFKDSNYSSIFSRYNDRDERLDRHGMVGLVKTELLNGFSLVRLAGRCAIKLAVTGPETKQAVEVFGVHLDDRSEPDRMAQTGDLISVTKSETPTIIAGDLNSMYKSGLLAFGLRRFGAIARHLPKIEPGPGHGGANMRRFGSLADRLAQMASGKTLEMLEINGFLNVDPNHTPTFGYGPLRVQLDHILTRGLLANNFRVHNSRNLSDHNPISAEVNLQ